MTVFAFHRPVKIHRQRDHSRLVFAGESASCDSFLPDLRTETVKPGNLETVHDPRLCPRCLELEGQRTDEATTGAQELYRCASCGQVWTAKRCAPSRRWI